MGFFSFVTSDTDESISNIHSDLGALPCKMIDDKGNHFVEREYDGYGEFGGKDYFELLAEIDKLVL